MPAFNPFRIIEEPSLLELLRYICNNGKQVYIMTHFNHINELTSEAVFKDLQNFI